MSSENIYITSQDLPYIPYVYIIQYKKDGRKYIGCRYSKSRTKFSINGANPVEFMKSGGYTTSSPAVNRIFKKHGADAFVILDIIPEDELQVPFGCQSVQEYEHWYLKRIESTERNRWLNRSFGGSLTEQAINSMKATVRIVEENGKTKAQNTAERAAKTIREKLDPDGSKSHSNSVKRMWNEIPFEERQKRCAAGVAARIAKLKEDPANHPLALKIGIFDSNGILIYTTHGNFKSFCREMGLPTSRFSISYSNGGEPIYTKGRKPTNKEMEQYIGWFAKILTEELV